MRDHGERLLQMERQLYDLQTEVNAARQRMVSQAATPQVRLGTIATAPTSGSDKIFGVVFLDGTFAETIGSGTATFTDRQNAYRHVAYNLGGTQPSIGDKVLCFWSGGRWWFEKGEGGSTPSEPSVASETMVLMAPRYWYTYGANAETEYTASEGFHYELGQKDQFYLSWKYVFNQQDWFQVSTTQPWYFLINRGGLYAFRVTVMSRPFRVQTASPAPDPMEQINHVIEFSSFPFSCTAATNANKILAMYHYNCGIDGTGDPLSGSFTEPTHGTFDYLGYVSGTEGSHYGQMNITPPSLNAFKIVSRLVKNPSGDYGIKTYDIRLAITRLATQDDLGTSCPIALTTVPS